VTLGQGPVDVYQFHTRDPQPSALKAGDDRPDQPTLYGVGFDDYQRTFHMSSLFCLS
jgi:hypothetical protein